MTRTGRINSAEIRSHRDVFMTRTGRKNSAENGCQIDMSMTCIGRINSAEIRCHKHVHRDVQEAQIQLKLEVIETCS